MARLSEMNVVAAGGQTRPLRYCVIRGLSSDSRLWRNRDSRHIIATQAGRRHGFLCSVLHLSQENVLSYPNASRKCVLFWENILAGTKFILRRYYRGGGWRSDSTAQVLRNSRSEFRLLPLAKRGYGRAKHVTILFQTTWQDDSR